MFVTKLKPLGTLFQPEENFSLEYRSGDRRDIEESDQNFPWVDFYCKKTLKHFECLELGKSCSSNLKSDEQFDLKKTGARHIARPVVY